MLSICIPVYNFDVNPLVNYLIRQIENQTQAIEILLLDDGSEESYKRLNQSLGKNKYVLYEELPENVGRSKIRNILAEKSHYDYLLFLDCDSKIENDGFLNKYIGYLDGDLCVYGGREYGQEPEDRNFFLQWYYSIHKNGAPAEERRQRQYHSFCTNNFVIAKKILLEHPFNDSLLKGWGHEDTLFAYSLKQSGYAVQHIENPILHKGHVSNEDFVDQMNEGLVNLLRIYQSGHYPVLVQDFKTTRFLKMLEKLSLTGIVAWKYRLFENTILKNIKGNRPSLLLFDLYKLGYMCLLIQNKKKQNS